MSLFKFTILSPAAENDPNTTPPDTSRVWSPGTYEAGVEATALLLALEGTGTTADVQVWAKGRGALDKWQAEGGTITVTAGIASTIGLLGVGDEVFLQVVSATGSPTKLHAGFGRPDGASITISGAGAATAANQTSGAQKTKVVDASGNVAPAGDTVGRASFVKVTDGTNTLGTTANPLVVAAQPAASVTTPAAVTAGNSATALASAGATRGVLVQADLANTTNVRVGDANVSATRGFQLAPGDSVFIPTDNASDVYHFAESGSPKLNVAII